MSQEQKHDSEPNPLQCDKPPSVPLQPVVGICPVCLGKKWVKYDSNHARPCSACCEHGKDGWWVLSPMHAGFDQDKDNRCCRGCGELYRDIHNSNPTVDHRPTGKGEKL